MTTYSPIVVHIAQNVYGYWVVTISVAPGRLTSVTIVTQGITPARAAELALESLPAITPTRRSK
jgi:hypothetical protein